MDNITKDSQDKLAVGIQKVIEVLAPTYGPGGSNVVIEAVESPFYRTTNDGKLIMDSIKLSDPIEEVARKMMANATNLAERESADGRKTTCLLTSAITLRAIKEKRNYMETYRSLQDCIPIIFDSLDKQKKEITVDEVKAVASIAAENEKVGTLVQEIYQQIGKDGIIEIDTSNLPETFYTITDGVRIRAGKFGKYSDTEEGKAMYKNPLILISKEKIVSVEQIEGILSIAKREGKNEMVLYVDDMDMSVASRLALTHMQGGFKTLIIKAPVLWKDWIYEDFAKLTCATPIDTREGKTFKNFTFNDFGKCDKIISTEDETRIIGTKDVSSHIKNLEEAAKEDQNQRVRISWLQTKIAILKVGGNSDTEIGYAIKKARDACSAAYWALKDGVVKGGGIALLEAIPSLPDTIGGNILKMALQEPHTRICANLGLDKEFILFPDSVLDAALTVKNAVKNAISIAGTNLTASSVITMPKVEQHYPNFPITR